MPNIPNNIKINAFKYVEENNIAKLTTLIESYPDLVNVRSQRDASTLFIRACEYLKKDILELLLNKGADPLATNNHGNNGIMYLFYRSKGTAQFNTDINAHDYKAVEILELLKKKNISLDCFTAQDTDKDTPLIEAVRAKLLECSKFIIELLKEQNLLQGQFSHQNNKGQDVFQLVASEEFLDKMLNEGKKTYSSFEIAKFHVNDAVRVSSPTIQEKDKLLSLIKEYLPKLDIKQVERLSNIIFQEKLYNETTGTDSTHHRENLEKEYASGNFGVKIFNSIDVELIELLYVAGEVDLLSYENFIDSLASLKDENLNSNGMCSAVILESNKQKILQIIKSSNTLTLLQNQKGLHYKEEDLVTAKDFALKRFCFLAANKANLEITKESEAGILLNFVNFLNNRKNCHYNIYDNFKIYLIKECKNYENFKKILDIHGDKIAEIIQFEDKLVSKLREVGNFEDNVDVLTNEIEKLLNPDLKDLLPKNVFLRSIDDKKEEKININNKKLLEDNLKFFTVSNTFQVPEYNKLDQEIFKNSIAYYKNNPDALIPNLVLLKTVNDEVKLSKIKDILNSHYIKAKSTVGTCLNVILDGQKYLKSLEIAGLNASLDEQNLVGKLPELAAKITKDLNTLEVENITLLCKEVKDFLNISPIASVFEEYDNNYQALKSDVDKAEKVLGEIGIEWSFS